MEDVEDAQRAFGPGVGMSRRGVVSTRGRVSVGVVWCRGDLSVWLVYRKKEYRK